LVEIFATVRVFILGDFENERLDAGEVNDLGVLEKLARATALEIQNTHFGPKDIRMRDIYHRPSKADGWFACAGVIGLAGSKFYAMPTMGVVRARWKVILPSTISPETRDVAEHRICRFHISIPVSIAPSGLSHVHVETPRRMGQAL
jgi:hypothetical protein